MDDEIEKAFNIKEWTVNHGPILHPKQWLRYDKWKKDLAVYRLLGIFKIESVDIEKSKIDPKLLSDDQMDYVNCEQVHTFDNKKYNEIEHPEIVSAFRNRIVEMDLILLNSKLTDDSSPQEYIDWALSKGFEISWLDWAIDNEFYKTSDSKKVVQTEFDDREINSMLKIIFCLAKKHYKYEEGGTVTKIIKDIESMPEKDQKYRINLKTLSKFLTLAKERI